MANKYGQGVYMLVNVIIVAVVVLGAFFGIRRAVGTATGRRDCCSGAKTSDARDFRPTRITDADESHYPYQADYRVAGMSCDNCVRRVTNALDSVAGTWATVDLASGTAHVRSKRPIDLAAYQDVVRQAGYRLLA